jgi:Transposase IS4
VSGAVETNNDNDPLLESLPTTNDNSECVYVTSCGHSGLCNHQMARASNTGPEQNFPIGFRLTLLENFKLYFPIYFITDTIIPIINQYVKLEAVQYSEFLCCLGLWFLMATIQGPTHQEFWKEELIDPFHVARICINEYMSKNCFKDILSSLLYR